MYPLAITLLGAFLFAASLAVTLPRDTELHQQTMAHTGAANFWAYRDALIAYKNDHQNIPSGTTIQLSDLIGPPNYLPVGFTWPTGWPNPAGQLWTNIVQDGLLYTYSVNAASTLPASTVDAIANRHGRSLMTGIATNNGTTITSIFRYKRDPLDPTQTYTEEPVIYGPPAILPSFPPGALVVVGN